MAGGKSGGEVLDVHGSDLFEVSHWAVGYDAGDSLGFELDGHVSAEEAGEVLEFGWVGLSGDEDYGFLGCGEVVWECPAVELGVCWGGFGVPCGCGVAAD